jgi:hypothetical protein
MRGSGIVTVIVLANAWVMAQQPTPQMVTVQEIYQRASELLNQPVLFLGLQQSFYERAADYFTERGISTAELPTSLRTGDFLGLVVRDFSGREGEDTIFVAGDRKSVQPPELAHNPPPLTLWLVGGHVRKVRDVLFVEVNNLAFQSKWQGYRLLKWQHWLELLGVLVALILLHAILFYAFFNLTERPSGSVRAAYLLCLWALVGYLVFREPFHSFFSFGSIAFFVLMGIAGVLSLLLLFSLLLRGT